MKKTIFLLGVLFLFGCYPQPQPQPQIIERIVEKEKPVYVPQPRRDFNIGIGVPIAPYYRPNASPYYRHETRPYYRYDNRPGTRPDRPDHYRR